MVGFGVEGDELVEQGKGVLCVDCFDYVCVDLSRVLGI